MFSACVGVAGYQTVLEGPLGEELTGHFGNGKHDQAGRGSGNSRNGTTSALLLTEVGGIELDVRELGPAA